MSFLAAFYMWILSTIHPAATGIDAVDPGARAASVQAPLPPPPPTRRTIRDGQLPRQISNGL